MTTFATDSQMQDLVNTWTAYLTSREFDWLAAVDGVAPKDFGSGLIYELGNPLARGNEDFAIADMRNVDIADPHYHLNDETEIYIVIQGTGTVVVGNHPREVGPGDVVVTHPGTAHYTVPHDQLVLGVINTPPFDASNYASLSESDDSVAFDAELFARLSKREQDNALNDLLRKLTVELEAWASVILLAGIRDDRLVCRARYELPLEWAVYGNFLDSGSDNATAFNRQVELIDNDLVQSLPPSPTAGAVSEHKMTASAVVLLPNRLGTLECLAETDGYVFDEAMVQRIRDAARQIADILNS